MTASSFDPSFAEEIGAALSIGWLLVFSPLQRKRYARWGATDAEVRRPLPGDEIAPNPTLESTRAITIRAPARKVWAWLAQIGQERGGLYTYQRLENLIGCQMHNAGRILPEWQNPQVGENVRLGPKGYPLYRITAVEPGRALVMQACDPKTEQPAQASWVFYLEPLKGSTTRLLTRARNCFEPTFGSRLMWRGIVDPIHFVMERRMLIGIRQRAEAG